MDFLLCPACQASLLMLLLLRLLLLPLKPIKYVQMQFICDETKERKRNIVWSLSLSIVAFTICYVCKINWTEFYQYGICHMMILI